MRYPISNSQEFCKCHSQHEKMFISLTARQFLIIYSCAKMFALDADNIYDIVRPLHLSSQLVGLTSFSIIKDNNQVHTAFVSVRNVLCIILSTVWNFFVIYKYLFTQSVWEFNREYLSSFFENVSKIALSCDVVILIFVNWWLCFRRNEILVILDKFNNIDQSLGKLNVFINHRKQKQFVTIFVMSLITMIFCGSLALLYASIVSNVYSYSLILFFADLHSLISSTLLSSQFIFLMLGIKIRYQSINEYLMRDMLESQINVRKPEAYNEITTLHDKLLDATEQISFCYGVPVSM